MLARMADAMRLAHGSEQGIIVPCGCFRELFGGETGLFAAIQRSGDLAHEPGPAEARAADHHAIRAGEAQGFKGLFNRFDVAIHQQGERNGLTDPRDRAPIRLPLVELLARAPMHRDERKAMRLGAPREFGRVEARMVPSKTHFQRDGHANGAFHGSNQAFRMVEIAHQRRAGPAIDHAFGGATHVDVNDIGARGLGHAGSFGHGVRRAARKLHHMQAKTPALGAQARFLLPGRELVGCNHFAHHHAGAEILGDPPEGVIRHAGHRREHRASRQGMPSNRQECDHDTQVAYKRGVAMILRSSARMPERQLVPFIRSRYRQVTHNESFFHFSVKGGARGLTKGPGPDETVEQPRGMAMADRKAALIIVAAGQGTRLGGAPKQYRPLAGKPVLSHLMARAGSISAIGPIITVTHSDHAKLYGEALAASGLKDDRAFRAPGGETRQASVRNGLELLAAAEFPADGIVLVHDAARPFLSELVVLRAILAAQAAGAAMPVLPVVDTVAEIDAAGALLGNPDRAKLRVVQTPQAFRFGPILVAHRAMAEKERFDFTDDSGLMLAAGQRVATFEGDDSLFKITLEADLVRARMHLGVPERLVRTGLGYDVHAFTDGDHVTLGGVAIPHERALLGHSDADPLLHAITDALLGTIGDGDIGQHFPPSDPRWKGAPSRVFLSSARARVESRGGRILNVDGTLICEAPKIGPHRETIATTIGEVLGLPPEAVGVKATTNEKLGFAGRREGIAAMAVATVAFSS